MTVEQLVEELKQALGPALKSVVLYGSAAAGDFVQGVSKYDVLLLVEPLDATRLKSMTSVIGRWQQSGHAPPELFTREELAASADVFPIELLDMQQSRRVLFGDDPLAQIKIDMQYFRLQLERDLKTRLLLLRRKYIECGGHADEIARLLTASVSTFLVLFRAALRLYDEAVPASKADSLWRLSQHIQFDRQPLITVLGMKEHKVRPAPHEMEPLFATYLESIQHVVGAVNRHLHSTST